MLVLDETPYEEPKEILRVAPLSVPKAAGMAALKLPVDIAGAGLIIAGGIDELAFGRDNFFKLYDEEIKPIQDKLTPEPGSVTKAGQFISGIAGFAPALALGPAAIPLLAGQAAINTGAGLVEQGVGPEAATGAAILAGASATAMAGIPNAAKTWTGTLALSALNPVIGAASTQAEKSLLEATGNEKAAEAYDPLDPVGRSIDAVLGLAFGAMGKYSLARREMLTKTKDSIDTVANWQRMFKDTPFDTLDPKTADLGYKAMQKALTDISEGKPVDLSGVLPDAVKLRTEAAPVRAEAHEAKQAIAEALAADASLQEHRVDRNLREHVQQLMETGDYNAVLDLVYQDPLTKTYNQKGWKRLEASGDLEGVAQGKSDLKKFKYLNDTYGDKFGDEVIAKSGEFLAEQPNVKVFRIGGDETAAVSTRNNPQDVIDAYENANKKLMEHPFTGKKKDGTLVTITGVDLVYGTGQNPAESAAARGANKQRLIDTGQYSTGRGDKSLSLVERPGEARPDVPPAKEVKPAASETAAQPADADLLSEAGAFMRDRTRVDHKQNSQLYRETNWLAARPAGWDFPKAGEFLEKVARGEEKPKTDAQKRFVEKALQGMREMKAEEARYNKLPLLPGEVEDIFANDPKIKSIEERMKYGGDFRVHMGVDSQGVPVTLSGRDFIQQARAEYDALLSKKDIFSRVSDCL